MARRVTASSGYQNQTKSNIGPLKWMAPEQISELAVSRESDVWAFGVVLYELLAREEPFLGVAPAVAAHKILSGQRLPLDDSWPLVMRSIMTDCW